MGARKLRKREYRPDTDLDAFWQYLLDHCMYETKAGFVIGNIILPSKGVLKSRLAARQRGLYRWDIKDIRYLPNPSFKRTWAKLKYFFRRDAHK